MIDESWIQGSFLERNREVKSLKVIKLLVVVEQPLARIPKRSCARGADSPSFLVLGLYRCRESRVTADFESIRRIRQWLDVG